MPRYWYRSKSISQACCAESPSSAPRTELESADSASSTSPFANRLAASTMIGATSSGAEDASVLGAGAGSPASDEASADTSRGGAAGTASASRKFDCGAGGGGTYALKSSESSPACAPATGVADFSGEGTGCRVIGAFLLSVFFLPNSEKNTRNYPPPGESAWRRKGPLRCITLLEPVQRGDPAMKSSCSRSRSPASDERHH